MRALRVVLMPSLLLALAAAAAGAACRVERASVGLGGEPADDFSGFPSLSADGRFVAFQSYASNLVADDTNHVTDVFVYDRRNAATERVSVDSAGVQALDLTGIGSELPAISADGRFVAFDSDAANLVGDDRNIVTDIFVHDRATGATQRVSLDSAGREANDVSTQPAISGDGRFVAFESIASNLVDNDVTECEIVFDQFIVRHNCSDIFVRDRMTGVTERVSADPQGNDSAGESHNSAISADGRYAAFDSDSDRLVTGDFNSARDVFVHDRLTGITERVSVGSEGEEGNADSFHPSLSADGRYVAFMSYANTLVTGDLTDTLTVKSFLHDRLTGSTERLGMGTFPALSATARYVASFSLDAFLSDRVSGLTTLVSADARGNPGDAFSTDVAISADGQTVAFRSDATNFSPGALNFGDVFVASGCTSALCGADCDGNGRVTVDELVTGVDIALKPSDLDRCARMDVNGDGAVTVDELVTAVNATLGGCVDRGQTVYRLVSDSGISPPPEAGQRITEGLNGAFIVAPAIPAPNSLFDFSIKRLHFRSSGFFGTPYVVDGSAGRISASTLDPSQLTAELAATINGQAVALSGVSSAETFTTDEHPTFQGVGLSGGGYELTLFAIPEP